MEKFLEFSGQKNINKDLLFSMIDPNDSVFVDHDLEMHYDEYRQSNCTLEIEPEIIQQNSDREIKEPIYIDINYNYDNSNILKSSINNYLFPNYNASQSKIISKSDIESASFISKQNNQKASLLNEKREKKHQLAKEEQTTQHLQKVLKLNESQKQTEFARKRKEDEINRKLAEKRLKNLERQRTVDEKKQHIIQVEKEKKSRILQKLLNQEEKRGTQQKVNKMTMSCYSSIGRDKSTDLNKEENDRFIEKRSFSLRRDNKSICYKEKKDRFIEKRPLSSTGKVIGFGSSSPRTICENSIKSTGKHLSKISDYLLERSEILSRPKSARLPERMTASVSVRNHSIVPEKPPVRQNSLKERKIKPTNSETNTKHIKKSKSLSIKRDETDGKISPLPKFRPTTRKSNNSKSKSSNNDETKKNPEKISSAKSIIQNNHKTTIGTLQLNSNTFSKVKHSPQAIKCKVDIHLDSDSIDDEGINLTESSNQLTSSSQSNRKSEINRTDLSSLDSLETDNYNNLKSQSLRRSQSAVSEHPTARSDILIRGLSTKDISEADYKARLMENRRLVREKRERERENLMKAERERRHLEETSVKEVIELEKTNTIHSDSHDVTTSSGDLAIKVSEKQKTNSFENESSIITETDSVAPDNNCKNEIENKERLERKKKLESIMNRFKKPIEESSSEGGGISPKRPLTPETDESNQDIQTKNSKFRSLLLQSMINKGKLTNILKDSVVPNEKDKSELSEDKTKDHNNNQTHIPLPLTSLRESVEDSEATITNPNSKLPENICNKIKDVPLNPESHNEDFDRLPNTGNVKCGISEHNDSDYYTQYSSIDTEEEIIKKDHPYNSHIIRPLSHEGIAYNT